MPAVIKIRVCSARNLPVMDRTTELTDAYITLQFADAPQLRTHVARRTLNPLWNREFRIEVADDNELQDHPLQIRCWDKDIMSSDDEIGAVTVDLNPLLLQPTQLSGWYPLYDTLRGFCGELSLVIKMDFIGDVNPFKESGAGVQFFSLAAPPAGMRLASVQGLVEELISAPDPEHHWVDSFRTARLSNERRQLLLAELSGKLRRQMGSKVLEAGGNAVLSFCITLDLEGEQSGAIVARGLGTSVKLRPAASAATLEPPLSPDPYLSSAAAAAAAVPPSAASPSSTISRQSSCTWRQHLWGGVPPPITAPANVAALAAAATAAALPPLPPPALRVDSRPHLSAGSGGGQSSPLHLRSSPQPRMPSLPSPPSSWPSAGLEARGKPPAAEGDEERGEGGGSSRRTGRQRSRAVSEVALLTMGSFPQHVPVRIGGVVSARSVKLLLSSSQAAQVARDGWWSDLRGEIRAHARSLSCSAVIGYRESVSFHDELAILSASGTAVRMHLPDDFSRRRRPPPTVCTLGHTPYAPTEPPFPTRMQPCGLCGRKHVPELLLATVDRPPWLPALGEPCVIQARVCRQKKRQQGEAHAAAVSQALPFLEYDLHRQLQYKLQIQGKNALFGLRVTVDVGETLLLAVAEATGLCLPLLPPARPLSIRRNIDVLDDEDRYLVQLQRQIEAASLASAAAHAPPPSPHANGGGMQPAGAMLPQDRATQAGHERRVRSPPGTPSGDKASGGRGPADGRFGERASRESRSSSSEDEADGRYTGGWRGYGADGLGSKPAFVVDVDDEMDEDMMAVLLDPPLPGDPTLLASEAELADAIAPLEMRGIAPERATLLSLVRRVRLDVANVAPNQLNQQFSRAIHELDAALAIKVRRLGPSLVYKATTKVAQPEEHEVELQLTAHALRYAPPAEADMPAKVAHSGEAAPVAEPEERDAGAKPTEAPPQERPAEAADPVSLAPPPVRVSVEKEAACEVAPESGAQPLAAVEVPPVPVGAAAAAAAAATTSSTRSSSSNVSGGVVGHGASASGGGRQSGDEVVLVPLSFVPGCATVGVLGPLSLHLIKETWSLREEGGVGNFCHAFVAEAQELARAHIGARGGNAALHFAAELNLTVHEPKKDHAYALIHCHADAALVRSLAEYRTWPSGAQS